jgi:hypothetical protein
MQLQGLLDKMTRFESVCLYVANRGGKMLTESISKSDESFYWSCENNHVNKSKSQIMYRGSWCKKCRSENTKEKVISSIKDGYKLINYSPTVCELICNKNHKIKITAAHILDGNGCGVCHKEKLKSGNQNRMSLDKVKLKLDRYGFSFLEKEYKSITTKHLLSCKNGHVFKKSIQHIINGSVGCPDCNNYFMKENKFRNTIEKLFKMPFPKSRPEWLINPNTGKRLELDCYNHENKLAFEFDGHFHFEERNGLNNDLVKQKERDAIKEKVCENNNVKLIRVPYFLKDKEFYDKIIEGLNYIYKDNYWKVLKNFELTGNYR